MSTLAVLFVGGVFSAISLKYFPVPYIVIAIVWLLLFVALTLTSKTSVKKAIWFNLAFLAFLLGGLETYSWFSLESQETNSQRNPERLEGEYVEGGYFVNDDILGYAPSRDVSITSRKYYNDELVYDVTYTIGADGLRITPPGGLNDADRCIIIFGGSFTFGEGVNDRESMPYRVGELQKEKVHNYGFHGYGPHQMLAAIENGLIKCRPTLAIYQAPLAHVARSAGYSSWDTHGPKYGLQDGVLAYQGHFDDVKVKGMYARIEDFTINQLKKSSFYKKYFLRKDTYTITDYDIELFLAIIGSSRQKLIDRFPELEFHVILWDNQPEDDTYLKVKAGLEKITSHIHLISDILPNFHHEPAETYGISAHDGHPNALTHRLVAEYVVNNMIEK